MRKVIFQSKFLLFLMVEIIVGVVLSLGMAIIFLKIFHGFIEADTGYIDGLVSAFVYSFRNPDLTWIMKFITDFGADYLMMISILLVFIFIWKNRKKEAVFFTLILIMGLLLNVLLKQIVQRPRPMMSPLVVASSYSFPSGHAMNSTVFYLALAFFYYRFTRRKKMSLLVLTGAMVLILLIGFSRIYLGVHYPSDVMAGYVAGAWWLVTAMLINKSYSFVNYYREEKKKLTY